MVLYGIIWYCSGMLVCNDMKWNVMVCNGMEWYVMVCNGMYGMVCNGM